MSVSNLGCYWAVSFAIRSGQGLQCVQAELL